VLKFKEKPDEATARSFLAQGNHYWNSGMFAFRADRYLEELSQHAPKVSRPFLEVAVADAAEHSATTKKTVLIPVGESIESCYGKAPSISIDYAVMEHSERCAAVPASFTWSDVGSWDVVAELFGSEAQETGKGGPITVDAAGNFVLSDLPVALAGVSDLIVVVKNGTVLVCRRGRSQLVRDIVQILKDDDRSDLL
jgi:mannose-1-phosphate guanylyltransferase